MQFHTTRKKKVSYLALLLSSVKKTIPLKRMKTPSKHSDTKLQWDGANPLKPNNVTANTAMQFPLPFLPVSIKDCFPVFKSLLKVLPHCSAPESWKTTRGINHLMIQNYLKTYLYVFPHNFRSIQLMFLMCQVSESCTQIFVFTILLFSCSTVGRGGGYSRLKSSVFSRVNQKLKQDEIREDYQALFTN